MGIRQRLASAVTDREVKSFAGKGYQPVGDLQLQLKLLMLMLMQEHCGLSPDDLMVSVMSNQKGDWSFGRGMAQYLTGEL